MQSFLRNYYPDIYPYFNQDYLQIEILSILMALVLYPYIYTACRISFSLIGSNYIKIAKNLGMSQLKTFFKIIIPISRVSIFSGLFLVIMEVLNEYGAVKYFGVNTFTSGIFRSWYSMEDVDTASILAVCLLIVVSIFFILERYSNSKYNYNYKSNDDVSGNYILNKSSKSLIYIICIIPFILGFFIPVIYIIKNAIDTFSKIDLNELTILSFNSFFLAFVSSLIIVIIAILFQFFKKISRSKTIFFFSEIVSLTYAIPGAVIALSLILIISAFSNFSGISIVFGSLIVLIYAYVMRYMAVGISPLKSSFEKHPESFDQTGRNLGMTNYKIFSKIHLPINKTSILIAFILCFVDIIKELPITLILRPFNFDTLAVKTYEYAIEEMIAKSSIYSLVIILFGTVLLIFLRKIINKSINVS
jgi:iron(III) transport system permease protein